MRIIKINFEKSYEKFYSITGLINGFINKCLGENNKWHDSFSPYCVSNMHGGIGKDGYLTFPNGGFLKISSPNDEFVEQFLEGLCKANGNIGIGTMKMSGFFMENVKTHKYYDISIVEDIRLKDNNKNITFENDSDYLRKLREHCVKKLMNNGFSFEEASTIKFEPYHQERWKKTVKKVKKSFTEASNIGLIIRGNKDVRNRLYELGIGQSTGCGFGFVNIR